MGILSGAQNRAIVDRVTSLADTTLARVVIPSQSPCDAPGCGYDKVSGGSINSSCMTCNGSGFVRVVSAGIIKGRVSWLDQNLLGMRGGLPSGVDADCQFQCSVHNKATVDLVFATDGAYIEIDETKLVPVSIIVNRVEKCTSLDVRLVRVNPDLLARE
jgi:hypothetical protein